MRYIINYIDRKETRNRKRISASVVRQKVRELLFKIDSLIQQPPPLEAESIHQITRLVTPQHMNVLGAISCGRNFGKMYGTDIDFDGIFDLYPNELQDTVNVQYLRGNL